MSETLICKIDKIRDSLPPNYDISINLAGENNGVAVEYHGSCRLVTWVAANTGNLVEDMEKALEEAIKHNSDSNKMEDGIISNKNISSCAFCGGAVEEGSGCDCRMARKHAGRFLDLDKCRSTDETPQVGSILKEASETINGGRQDQYGSPEDSFQLIADYWSLYLGSQILKEDVAFMMVLLKMARQQNQHKRDNLVDAVGYLGILGDMEGRN